MGTPHVDVVDPTPEGALLSSALVARGFQVRRRMITDIAEGTDAGVLILAAEAPGAIDILRGLRDRSGKLCLTPVILIGSPSGATRDERRARDLGADAFVPRPVDASALASQIDMWAGISLREIEPEEAARAAFKPSSSEHETSQTGESSTPSASMTPTSALWDPASAPEDSEASVSWRLRKLLRDGDERIFHDAPPLHGVFRAAGQSPEELVPDDSLDDPNYAIDRLDDDTFEHLVHTSPSPARTSKEGSSPGTPSPFADSRVQGTPKSKDADGVDDSVGTQVFRSSRHSSSGALVAEPTPPPLVLAIHALEPGRLPDRVLTESPQNCVGALKSGAAIAALWELGARHSIAEIELRPEGRSSIRMSVFSGEVRSFECADLPPPDPADSLFMRAKRAATSRMHLLGDALAADRGQFFVRLNPKPAPLDAAQARPFAIPLRPLAIACARRSLHPSDVQAWLGTADIHVEAAPRLRQITSNLSSPISFFRAALSASIRSVTARRRSRDLQALCSD